MTTVRLTTSMNLLFFRSVRGTFEMPAKYAPCSRLPSWLGLRATVSEIKYLQRYLIRSSVSVYQANYRKNRCPLIEMNVKLIVSIGLFQVTSEYLQFDDEDQENSNARSNISPYGPAEDPYNNRIYYCYYEPSKISS